MTESNQHPITPPTELVREWNQNAIGTHFPPYGYSEYIATQAARWGADQELESCVTEVSFWGSTGLADKLRAARRPKPQTLAERGLSSLDKIVDMNATYLDAAYIREALQRLKELKNQQ